MASFVSQVFTETIQTLCKFVLELVSWCGPVLCKSMTSQIRSWLVTRRSWPSQILTWLWPRPQYIYGSHISSDSSWTPAQLQGIEDYLWWLRFFLCQWTSLKYHFSLCYSNVHMCDSCCSKSKVHKKIAGCSTGCGWGFKISSIHSATHPGQELYAQTTERLVDDFKYWQYWCRKYCMTEIKIKLKLPYAERGPQILRALRY